MSSQSVAILVIRIVRWLPALPVLFYLNNSHAQSTDTAIRYLNENLEITNRSQGKYTARLFRTGMQYGATVTDDSGRLVFTGIYKDKQMVTRNGLFTFYYPDGKKKSEVTILNDRAEGPWIKWHPDGKLNDSTVYTRGTKTGFSRAWHENGNLLSEGYYANNLPDSSWSWYYENGKCSTREKYSSGRLFSLECFDTTGQYTGFSCSLDKPPTIKGMYGGLEKLITDSLLYPREAWQKRIEGNVELEFVITKKGVLEGLRILNSPSPLLSDEVIRVLNMPKGWYPAVEHNREVDRKLRINVPFYISD